MKKLLVLFTLCLLSNSSFAYVEVNKQNLDFITNNARVAEVVEEMGLHSAEEAIEFYNDEFRRFKKDNPKAKKGTFAICGNFQLGLGLNVQYAICTNILRSYKIKLLTLGGLGGVDVGVNAIYFDYKPNETNEYFYSGGLRLSFSYFYGGDITYMNQVECEDMSYKKFRAKYFFKKKPCKDSIPDKEKGFIGLLGFKVGFSTGIGTDSAIGVAVKKL